MKKLISLFISACMLLISASISVQASPSVDSVDFTEMPQKIRIDHSIQKTVQDYAPNAEEWWSWYNSLPLIDDKYVNQNSVAIWLTDFSKLTPEEKECVNYNPLLFPEMKKMAAEESLSVSSLPLGGYEHDFDFDLWEKVKKKANCYAYVLNTYAREGYAPSPGTKSATTNILPEYTLSYMRTHLAEILAEDAPYFNGKTITKCSTYTTPETRQYKIACAFSEGESGIDGGDFHFYRQDSNGYFSHKRGFTSITKLDASQNFITNPQTCNRNYNSKRANYSYFAGFFMVTY